MEVAERVHVGTEEGQTGVLSGEHRTGVTEEVKDGRLLWASPPASPSARWLCPLLHFLLAFCPGEQVVLGHWPEL